MKHTKYTGIASLVFTIIPFISTLLTSCISLPFSEEVSYKAIMSVLFVIGWVILAYIICDMPDDVLQKFRLIKDASRKLWGYWVIEYNENPIMPCSILEFRDDCGKVTASKLCDFEMDLSVMKKLGVHNLQFNGDDQLIQIFARGSSNCAFVRFEYRHEDTFDIIRIDDNEVAVPTKEKGKCYRIRPQLLLQAGICEDEKTAKAMLHKFKLNPQNVEHLLLHIYRNKHTDFSQKILDSYNIRLARGGRVAEESTYFGRNKKQKAKNQKEVKKSSS